MNYSSNNSLTTNPVIILLKYFLLIEKYYINVKEIDTISEFINIKMTSAIQLYHHTKKIKQTFYLKGKIWGVGGRGEREREIISVVSTLAYPNIFASLHT